MRALEPNPDDRILDLAAGTGSSTLPFEQAGAFAVPCDFSIGMLTDSALVVLGLHQSRTFYTRSDRHSDVFQHSPGSSAALQELAADATAAFQVANQVYLERRYHLP